MSTIAVHRATAAPPASIRLVPAPRSEPPTDQELEDAGIEPPPMGAPPLPFDLPSRVPVPARSRADGLAQHIAIGDPGLPSAAETHSSTGNATASSAQALATGLAGGHAESAAFASVPTRVDGMSPASGVRCVDPAGPAQRAPTGLASSTEQAVVGATRSPAAPVRADDTARTADSTPSTDPSPARLATRRFLGTCVEVIGGFRPVAQLRPLCLPEAFADVAKALLAQPTTNGSERWRGYAYAARKPVSGKGIGAPPRTGRANQRGPGDRISVRRVQICETREDAAEVAVVLARREQVWAMALRLECIRERWLCTHLEVL